MTIYSKQFPFNPKPGGVKPPSSSRGRLPPPRPKPPRQPILLIHHIITYSLFAYYMHATAYTIQRHYFMSVAYLLFAYYMHYYLQLQVRVSDATLFAYALILGILIYTINCVWLYFQYLVYIVDSVTRLRLCHNLDNKLRN